MSKENLSNKSSINASKEGIKNATESNANQPDISQKSETLEPPKKSKQESQDTRRVLKDDKGLKAGRIARVLAAAGMVIASAFSNPIKAVENIPKLAAPLDNLSAGGVIRKRGSSS